MSPRTFARWVNAQKTIFRKPSTKTGRPQTPGEVEQVVPRLARENAWGYTRILGELKKLGVHRICRSTVVNILRRHGLDPKPRRDEKTWDEFIRRHGQTLWACDFFTKNVWTMKSLVEVYALFFIHVGSRRVYVSGLTPHPNGPWMKQQARNVAMHFAEQPTKPRISLRDNDTKFCADFDAILEEEDVEVIKIGPVAPNLNAHAERFVQTVKVECLDRFIVFGEDHLRHLLAEYVAYYHAARPHQGLGNVTPCGPAPPDPTPLAAGDIVCEEHLGGLLKHYSRRAA